MKKLNLLSISPTDSAWNLGVEFDKDFNFKKHIRDLHRFRRCSPATVTKTIAISLVSSKLNYCNSIYNSPNHEINKLQSVQNCLAWVLTRSPRFCSVTPLLKSLFWLPVPFGKNWKLYISAKLFHPKSSVSRHAGSTNWNGKRDTEDLGQ